MDPRLGPLVASIRVRLQRVCADWPSDELDALVHEIARRTLRWQERDLK